MSVIASAIVTAVITGGATYLASQNSSRAANRATDAATTAANNNNALQKEIYDRNTANLSPWMTRGNAAGEQINGLLGIGGNPQAASQAFDQYRNSTGYQFQMDQGMQGVNHANAAAGGRISGNAIKAGQRFGQGLASTTFQNYLNNLQGVSGQGLGAGSSVAGVGTGYANAVGANNNAAADATGNAALLGASNTNSLLGQFGQLGANLLGQSRGFTGSSYGGVGGKPMTPFDVAPW